MRTRPPESRSRVETAFANTTGSWYGSTITDESTTIRDVAPATNAIAVMACDHCGPMSPTMSFGITMCSGIASEWYPSSSAVRATTWKSPGAIDRSHSLLIGG